MSKIKPYGKDINDLERELKDRERNAEVTDSTPDIPLAELFPVGFLTKYTDFSSLEAMVQTSGFEIASRQDVDTSLNLSGTISSLDTHSSRVGIRCSRPRQSNGRHASSDCDTADPREWSAYAATRFSTHVAPWDTPSMNSTPQRLGWFARSYSPGREEDGNHETRCQEKSKGDSRRHALRAVV